MDRLKTQLFLDSWKRRGHTANCYPQNWKRQVNTRSDSLPENRLTRRNYSGNCCLVGTELNYNWIARESVWTTLRVKNSRGHSHKGAQVFWDLYPKVQADSHTKYLKQTNKKNLLGLLAWLGEKKPCENMPECPILLNKAYPQGKFD